MKKLTTPRLGAAVATALLTSAMLVGGQPAPAQAADFVLKFATPTRNSAQEVYGQLLKGMVENASGGRIEVQLFPGGQLGSPQASIEGLQLGTVDGYIAPIDFFVGLDKRAGVFSIPFMFKSRAQANRAIDSDPKITQTLFDVMAEHGIYGCELFSLNDGLYMAHKPIEKVDDFKGLKMRINATPAENERFKLLGATSVPMGLPDMLTSIQSGVIDGSMSGIAIWVNFNLETVSKQLLETEDTLLVAFAGLSQKWIDGLPKDLQEAVKTDCRSLHQPMVQAGNDDNKRLRDTWAARGGTRYHFSDAEMKKFKDLIGPVGETVTKDDKQLHDYYLLVKAANERTD